LTYDNLSTAVKEVLTGKNRLEQEGFVVFRSHYLFDSHFCTPAQGHEKGGVESGVGYARRNFLSPILKFANFGELNAYLLEKCEQEGQRKVDRQTVTIGEALAQEKPLLRPLPAYPYRCCVSLPVVLNPYSQVRYQTNRYSVPADKAKKQLVLRVYPFEVEILDGETVLARHPRHYGREEDILDPLHYLPLLERRPGAFEHAKPMRAWRKQWHANYERLLAALQAKWPEGRGVREFVTILMLHRQHPTYLVEQAIAQALEYGCTHLDGVKLCLQQLLEPGVVPVSLDLSLHSGLRDVGQQSLDLKMYEQLYMEELGETNDNGKTSVSGKLFEAIEAAHDFAAVPAPGTECGNGEPAL
jgi:hypothetical protein